VAVRTLRVGTRRSPLARAQAGAVAAWLEAQGLACALVEVVTAGDRAAEEAGGSALGRGAFVKDLEAALLAGRVDLAVHSAKDVPPEVPPGLTLAAFPARADPRDALVARGPWTLASLPAGARVGTGSPRRAALLAVERPDVEAVPLRGNVDTRLRRLDAGDFDAVLLAAAGLERLGLAGRAAERLDPWRFVPAAGQGALAVEARAADGWLLRLLRGLDDAPTRARVVAERAVLAALAAGCRSAVGAYADWDGEALRLAAVRVPEGGEPIRVEETARLPEPAHPAAVEAAAALGRRVGERLRGG
jgi:hydroxymethylbilane synthase